MFPSIKLKLQYVAEKADQILSIDWREKLMQTALTCFYLLIANDVSKKLILVNT